MIYNYLQYIKEGGPNQDNVIYWMFELERKLNKNWTELSSVRYTGDIYNIKFKAGDDQYDYFSVLVEKKGTKEFYYFENSNAAKDIVEIFEKKLNQEFWKKPELYYEKFKYVPKCIGDISHLHKAGQYNL